MLSTSGYRAAAVCGLLALVSTIGRAADAPILRQGVVEAGGFVGASYGVDKARVMGGGNIVYSLTKVLMPYGEVSYFPGILRSFDIPNSTSKVQADIPLTDLNFGLHIRVPIPKSRIIPYGVIGFGLLHSSSGKEFEVRNGVKSAVGQDRAASTDYTTSFGGGLRYYATERWGFRVEAKGYKPNGIYKDVFYRITGGFFYQF